MVKKTQLRHNTEELINQAYEFTKVHESCANLDKAKREVECLKVQFPFSMCDYIEGDTFVGRTANLPVGFYPHYTGFFPVENPNTFGYYCDEAALDYVAQGEYEEKVSLIKAYWREHATKVHLKDSYPSEMKKSLRYDDYLTEPAVAHPLYRLASSQLDFGKLIDNGVEGLKAMLKDGPFGNACAELLDIYTAVCDYYIANTQNCEIVKSLQNIRLHAANSFRDAIQMMILWWSLSGTMNLARMDTYLYKYYVKDLDSGLISYDEALALMCGAWELFIDKNRVYDMRVVLGGRDRANIAEQDRFVLLALDTVMKMKDVTPQVSLRLYEGMSREVYEKALQAIGEGCTFPMLYNDDVNIPAVIKAFGLPEEEAERYCPYGCGEYVIEHRSLGTPSGIINLAKALEITLNNGKDMLTGEGLGLDLGSLCDFKSFDELFSAYKKQVEYFVELLAKQEELAYVIPAQEAEFLGLSLLYDDCIERDKGILNGGVRYLGGTLEAYGNTNTADSLYAIKKAVYDNGLVERGELLEALRNDFEGTEEIREILLRLPKYGNDIEDVDAMLEKVHEHICTTTSEMGKRTMLDTYLVVVINNDANSHLGSWTAASADGRRARQFLANANNPTGGRDKNGLTAMLNSITKPDCTIHAGSVQNLKLSKEHFKTENMANTKALLDGYFKNGGTQLMITVVSKDDLENAMREPEKYTNLIVRVGGFSARFVELDEIVQREVISRSMF